MSVAVVLHCYFYGVGAIMCTYIVFVYLVQSTLSRKVYGKKRQRLRPKQHVQEQSNRALMSMLKVWVI